MTELLWEGKYRDGPKGRERVGPVRIALPFQTVETVNESAQDRGRTLDLFATGKPTEWRNRLIWGDKKYVLPSLLPEFAGKVNLVYIDPPFDTGADFSFTTQIPDTKETLEKEPSIIEQKAYRDTWGKGLDSYVQWFHETAVLLRELLADPGSIYVHLDYHVAHYAKVVLDEVFGIDNFRSEIIWRRTGSHGKARRYGPVHDVIFFYSKTAAFTWNDPVRPYMKGHVEEYFVRDEAGRWKTAYYGNVLTGSGTRQGESGKAWRGIDPTVKGRHWAIPGKLLEELSEDLSGLSQHQKLDRLFEAGLVKLVPGEAWPIYERYLSPKDGTPLSDLWGYQPYTEGTVHGSAAGIDSDVRWLAPKDGERSGYPTQKPEGLLERILSTSSSTGDLVLDCFCGSGTTATVAERLGRRWITCDLGRFAIHTTRKRLLSKQGLKPFVVQNLGKYERQAWMTAEFEKPEDRAATEERYRQFIMQLFHAEPISGRAWIHGVKGGRMVHVGPVDAPITLADIKSIARDAWQAGGATKGATKAEVDVLGWDFAFETNEIARNVAGEAGVKIVPRRIPREVLEKKAQGDIHDRDFFELRALSTKVVAKKRAVTLSLTDFILPPEDLPEDVRAAVKHWSQWIDYWAVDWDHKDDTFHNEWQSYRSKGSPELELTTRHEYRDAATYRVVVKVIDLLGNDTTQMLTVTVE